MYDKYLWELKNSNDDIYKLAQCTIVIMQMHIPYLKDVYTNSNAYASSHGFIEPRLPRMIIFFVLSDIPSDILARINISYTCRVYTRTHVYDARVQPRMYILRTAKRAYRIECLQHILCNFAQVTIMPYEYVHVPWLVANSEDKQ